MKIQESQSKLLTSLLALLCAVVKVAEGHGRLLDPPSRSSAWREGFPVPPDYNDTEGFCGGYERQWLVNKGQCGICGDPFDEAIKPHQAPGGTFATGTIVRNYTEGQTIPVKIDITALHKGYYEFKICANDNVNLDPPQSCFDRNPPLDFVDGTPFTKYDVTKLTTGKFEVRLQLPPRITCTQCIIQWTYVTGNRWGTCVNGTQGLGCGPQETFRACSDIGIYPRGGPVPTGPPMIPITTEQPAVPISPFPTVQPPPIILPESTTQPSLPLPTGPPPVIILPVPTEQPPVITLPPLTLPPIIGTGCSSYYPVPSQQIITGMFDWCNNNCRRGYCPSNYCICIP